MVVPYKAYAWGQSVVGIVGSYSVKGMDICHAFELCCVGSTLCDQLITRSEQCYWVRVLIVCDLETSNIRRPRSEYGCLATEWKARNLQHEHRCC
jgi:hypothetical protein